MREIRTPGSVRGAPGNRRPYLDRRNMNAPFGDDGLLGYRVDGINQTIVFRTEREIDGVTRSTEIIFRGVVGYQIECAATCVVVGWILERSLDDFLSRLRPGYDGELRDTIRRAPQNSLRAFELVPAAGDMSAFILAQGFESIAVPNWPNQAEHAER